MKIQENVFNKISQNVITFSEKETITGYGFVVKRIIYKWLLSQALLSVAHNDLHKIIPTINQNFIESNDLIMKIVHILIEFHA